MSKEEDQRIMDACAAECKAHQDRSHNAVWGSNYVTCTSCPTHITIYVNNAGAIVYHDDMFIRENKPSTVYTISKFPQSNT